MTRPIVYFVQGWEAENIGDISKQLKNRCNDDQKENDLFCIGSSCSPGPDSAASLTAYLMNVYRTHGGLKVGRTTILSAEDGMLGLQLCLADINLQGSGEFDAPISDVLTEMNHIAQRKLEKDKVVESEETGIAGIDHLAKEQKEVFEKYQKFLESSYYVDLHDLLNFYRDKCCKQQQDDEKCLNDKSFIIFDSPGNDVEKAMFSFLCSTRELISVVVEESELEEDGKEGVHLEFHPVSNPSELVEPNCQPKTPKCNRLNLSAKFTKTPKTNHSDLTPTQKYIRQVFLSYIDLLVNSNSSISLARVINIPDREIDHNGFTLLKRRAQKSNLSMYQFAISLVMKIRLGGKGYAPDRNDPLMTYVSGLSNFVDFLHSLHTIIEDQPDARLACQQVVKVIKKALLKSKESLSRKPAVDEMADKVQEDIKAAHEDIEARAQNSSTSSIPANRGGSRIGGKALRVLQAVLDQHVINTTGASDTGALSDAFLTQGTPLRLPSLLSQFRSPEPNMSPEKSKPLAERLSQHLVNKQIVPRSKSFLSWAAPSIKDHVPVKEVEYILPSKTLVCPASGKKIYSHISEIEKENIPNESLSTNDTNIESKEVSEMKMKETPKIGAKRKRPDTKSNLPKKKVCKKLLPQIKGQTTLNFFVKK